MKDIDTARQLVDKYADLALRVAWTYLGERCDAEDIAQEVLIKLMCDAPEFRSPEHERAWVIRCTLNACKDLVKSARYKKVLPFEALSREPSTEDQALLEGQEEQEVNNRVLAEVMALPTAAREVVYLYYYEELSIREIVEQLGISEAAVTKRLSRARAMLKIVLQDTSDTHNPAHPTRLMGGSYGN